MRHFLALTTLLIAPHLSWAQEESELALTVVPAFQWLTDAEPWGTLRLTNKGTAASEITISIDPLVDAVGETAFGDLEQHLTLFPPRLILEPGETKIVRYSIKDTPSLSPGGHVAFVRLHMDRRTPISGQQTPNTAASLRLNYAMLVPLVFVRESGEPQIDVRVVSQSPDMLVVALENRGNSPWGGNIRVESADGLTTYGSTTAVVFGTKELEVVLDAPLPGTVRFVFDEDLERVPTPAIHTPEAVTITF